MYHINHEDLSVDTINSPENIDHVGKGLTQRFSHVKEAVIVSADFLVPPIW